MGSIKSSLEFQKALDELCATFTDPPEDGQPGKAYALQVDINRLEKLVNTLSLIEHGHYVNPSIEWVRLAEGTLAPILGKLKSQGSVLLVDNRFVKINQKQRPKRKLTIPREECPDGIHRSET